MTLRSRVIYIIFKGNRPLGAFSDEAEAMKSLRGEQEKAERANGRSPHMGAVLLWEEPALARLIKAAGVREMERPPRILVPGDKVKVKATEASGTVLEVKGIQGGIDEVKVETSCTVCWYLETELEVIEKATSNYPVTFIKGERVQYQSPGQSHDNGKWGTVINQVNKDIVEVDFDGSVVAVYVNKEVLLKE